MLVSVRRYLVFELTVWNTLSHMGLSVASWPFESHPVVWSSLAICESGALQRWLGFPAVDSKKLAWFHVTCWTETENT